VTEPVALAVVNARVWTGDPRRPWADAVAVAGDRIAAVGSSAEIRKLTPSSLRTIDAHGMMLVPGFIDAHIHLLEGGRRLASVQLRDAASRTDVAARIRDFAAGAAGGVWITGGDWDHERWGGELPSRAWIDDAAPRHPVWVMRHDGHMGLANTVALRAAGITAHSPDVPGGTIVRDATGEPTGVLKDNAMDLMRRAAPLEPQDLADRALDSAMRHVTAQGVTSVHHMGTWDDLAVFERAHAAGRLRTRISAAVPLASWERLRDEISARGSGDEWLRIGSLKAFVDGSLGSRTALLFEPYDDTPGNAGLFVTEPDDLEAWTTHADHAGLHVVVHAIGDRANRIQLDVFERAARKNGSRDRRFRIEHAQHLHPADIPRFGALGVIASMQPYHVIDDGRWAERALGARITTTYAFRALLDAGGTLAFGSDWFVAPPTPLEGIYASVTRRTLDDRHPNGWVPDQRITVEEALTAYTRGSAYALFEEAARGRIARGMLADFVLIDRDLTRIPVESIRDARVVLTVTGGSVSFERADAHAGPAAHP
jgi:hypothetical protein